MVTEVSVAEPKLLRLTMGVTVLTQVVPTGFTMALMPASRAKGGLHLLEEARATRMGLLAIQVCIRVAWSFENMYMHASLT